MIVGIALGAFFVGIVLTRRLLRSYGASRFSNRRLLLSRMETDWQAKVAVRLAAEQALSKRTGQ